MRKKRRRTSSLATSKKKRRLLPFSPSEDPETRLRQMASLATALTATGADFSNQLTYIRGMAPKSANSPAHEKEGMQVSNSNLNKQHFILFNPTQPHLQLLDYQSLFRFYQEKTLMH